MFLWEQKDNSWYGIYGDNIIKFSASTTNFNSFTRGDKNNTIQFSSYPEVEGWERKVFRFDDDIKKIISTVSKDTLVYKAIRKYPGLRLMRQEPHQCIFSFVCASNTNMLMTRKMLKNVSKKFGLQNTRRYSYWIGRNVFIHLINIDTGKSRSVMRSITQLMVVIASPNDVRKEREALDRTIQKVNRGGFKLTSSTLGNRYLSRFSP